MDMAFMVRITVRRSPVFLILRRRLMRVSPMALEVTEGFLLSRRTLSRSSLVMKSEARRMVWIAGTELSN